LQNVAGEQEIVIGGYAVHSTLSPTTMQNFALARPHAGGSADTSFGLNGNGISTPQFYATKQDNTGNAIAIEQAISPACNDTTTLWQR
jgi:hypothetical protein